MSKNRTLHIVLTECPPENDAKFNRWYNGVHIPMLMKYKGIKKVTRYKITEEKQAKPRYLAMYEYANIKDLQGMDASPAFQAAREEMEETWKGQMFDIGWVLDCEPIKTWES